MDTKEEDANLLHEAVMPLNPPFARVEAPEMVRPVVGPNQSKIVGLPEDQIPPREKLRQFGVKSLSDAELLAIMLRTGIKGKNVIELAREMLRDNDFAMLNNLSLGYMKSHFKGIGEVKAIQILAAIEFGVRRQSAITSKPKKIITAEDIVNCIFDFAADLNEEHCWAIYMRQNHTMIGRPIEVAAGGWTSVVVDVRTIMREALGRNAPCVAIAHNHPSGNNTPSDGDRHVTRRMREAARTLDIQFLDHVIITNNPKLYYSFMEQGEI